MPAVTLITLDAAAAPLLSFSPVAEMAEVSLDSFLLLAHGG